MEWIPLLVWDHVRPPKLSCFLKVARFYRVTWVIGPIGWYSWRLLKMESMGWSQPMGASGGFFTSYFELHASKEWLRLPVLHAMAHCEHHPRREFSRLQRIVEIWKYSDCCIERIDTGTTSVLMFRNLVNYTYCFTAPWLVSTDAVSCSTLWNMIPADLFFFHDGLAPAPARYPVVSQPNGWY